MPLTKRNVAATVLLLAAVTGAGVVALRRPAAGPVNEPPQAGPEAAATPQQLTGEELERRAAGAYERAGAAFAEVEIFGAPTGFAGVIVTPDGHVVCSLDAWKGKVTFRLSDGRR